MALEPSDVRIELHNQGEMSINVRGDFRHGGLANGHVIASMSIESTRGEDETGPPLITERPMSHNECYDTWVVLARRALSFLSSERNAYEQR